jgi:integrase
MTFGTFADKFLKDHPGSRRSDHYDTAVARLKLDLGTKPLREITRADLDAYSVKLQTETSKAIGRPLSPTTVLKLLRVLHRIFKMAVRWGELDSNPAAEMEKPAPSRAKTRYLSADEIKKLEMAAPPWLRPFLSLAVASGLRLKELCELRWQDVDLDGGFLYVAQDTKTGTRAVPLSGAAKDVLETLKKRRRDLRAALGIGHPLPHVFVTDEGHPYGTETARNMISKATLVATAAAEIEGASFHTLRHTAASIMVQAGVPLYEVQKYLGHSTPTMTERYAHLAPEHLKRAAAALDAVLRQGPNSVPTQKTADGERDAQSA